MQNTKPSSCGMELQIKTKNILMAVNEEDVFLIMYIMHIFYLFL